MNKKTSLIIATSLTATFVALTAAFFSVTGIAKLFAGASFSILIMAAALELGKIVGISFLYQYWEEIPKTLKSYLTVASGTLMLITSIGIYGYLSAAYQATSDQLSIIDQQVATLELRKNRYQEELTLYLQERDRLSTSIENLNRGLAGNIVQYRDAQSGQIITTTSSANRTALQQQLTAAAEERTNLSSRIETSSDSISSIETQIIELNLNNDLAAEIGPLRFVSNVTGWPIDKVVNIFAIMIVLVFDPLAIALIISVNFLLKHRSPTEDDESINNISVPPITVFPTNVPDHTDNSIHASVDVSAEPVIEEEPYQVYAAPQEESTEELNTDEPDTSTQKLRSFDEVFNVPPQMNWDLVEQFFKYKYGGVPNWMHPNFNWNSPDYEWKRNPLAVEYKQAVVDKRKT
jgi:hypothetical protein